VGCSAPLGHTVPGPPGCSLADALYAVGLKQSGNASGFVATRNASTHMNPLMIAAVSRMMLRKSTNRMYSSSEASYAVSMACLRAARRMVASRLRSARSARTRRGSLRSITVVDVTTYDTPPKWKATMTVGPHRMLYTQQTWLFVDEPYAAQLSTAVGGNGPIPDSAARTLIAGFESVGRPDEPATW
jgi:hypothetical protein